MGFLHILFQVIIQLITVRLVWRTAVHQIVWNWKGYSTRYQNAGNSGPALVLAHSFGANRTLPLSSSPVVAWKLPSLANLLQQQIHLPLGLPAPICCWKLPPAAESLLLFPLDFFRSFSWLVLIKPSPSEFGCEMPCLVLSMKASMMETQEEKDRLRKVSQRSWLTTHFFLALTIGKKLSQSLQNHVRVYTIDLLGYGFSHQNLANLEINPFVQLRHGLLSYMTPVSM